MLLVRDIDSFHIHVISFARKQILSLISDAMTWGLSYQYGLTLIPAWISNYIIIKCGMKLLIHSQTSKVQPLKFGNG